MNGNTKNKRASKTSWSRRRRPRRKQRKTQETTKYVSKNGRMQDDLKERLRESLRFDPRASQSVELDLYADNMNSVIPYRVPVNAEAFAGPVLAAVSYAAQRGWSLTSNLPSDPYHASTYMIQTLIACAKNEVPQMTSVPRWFHYLCQAVTERKVKARGGQMDYSFEVLTDWSNPTMIPMGPLLDQEYILQNKASTVINGIFRGSSAPVAYTPELGARAAQSMWLYLGARHPDSPMHELVSISDTTTLSRDASAFAIIQSAPGGGYAGGGGWNKKVELEVPVSAPLFSVFAGSLTDRGEGDNSRAPNFLRNFSGDGLMLGGLLTYKLMPEELRMKTPPNIHFVDFNEFLDVLAQSMTLAIGRRLSDLDTLEQIQANPNYYDTEIKCPLTIQEVGLLLRATIMSAFDDSQLLGQATYPRGSTRGGNEFVSFLCGMNTCPQSGATLMRIPMLLKENILALRERVIFSGGGGRSNPTMWTPILGQYQDDILPSSDYFNPGPNEVDYDTFTTCLTEQPISFVDGRTSTNDHAWINDPGALTVLAEQWNIWTVKMSDYFWNMDTIGADSGIDPLFSGCMTLHWVNLDRDSKKAKRKSTPDPMSERFQRLEVPSAIYSARKALAVSSYVGPFKNAWEGAQQFFVLPINKIAPVLTGDPRTFTGYTRIAGFHSEAYQIPLGSGDINFVTQADRHLLLATQMIKMKFSVQDITQETIKKIDLDGDGGILSSLVAALAGKLVPGIGPIAEALAPIIPF